LVATWSHNIASDSNLSAPVCIHTATPSASNIRCERYACTSRRRCNLTCKPKLQQWAKCNLHHMQSLGSYLFLPSKSRGSPTCQPDRKFASSLSCKYSSFLLSTWNHLAHIH
jgi:hypothetical protein